MKKASILIILLLFLAPVAWADDEPQEDKNIEIALAPRSINRNMNQFDRFNSFGTTDSTSSGDSILLSGTTDKILLSGTTDKLLMD